MAKSLNFPTMPLAEEYDVGDDSDLPGFDQPITVDDIDAIVDSSRMSIEEKRGLLARILDDLQARRGMDLSHDFDDLAGRVRDGIATLKLPPDGDGTPSAYGFDANDRLMQPDEILERAEEEAADDRDEP
jgi:hypothetical protein